MPSESGIDKNLMEQLVKAQLQNQALIEQLVKSQMQNQKPESSTDLSSASLSAIESRINEFVYCPEEGSTFERWWGRHEDIFLIDLKQWEDLKKIRLLIRHVSTTVERTFTESIAPTKWADMTLDQVKSKMLTLFGDNTSIFDRRRMMLDLKMSKENIDDVRVLAARVNQTVENAQVSDASINEWKVLTFLHSLDLSRYSDVHMKMMQTAKHKGKECTLDDLLSDYNDMSQLKKDSRNITDSHREVNYVSDIRSRKKQNDKKSNRKQRDCSSGSEGTVHERRTACHCCGSEAHWRADCPLRSAKCNICGRQGHIARVCKDKKVNTVMVLGVTHTRFCIQVEINGLALSTVVDTGADISIISEETWKQLGRPECKRDSGMIKCANGENLKLIGSFCAKVEYGGIAATSDVYVTRGQMNLLGKDFIKLLKLVKVRSPEAKEKLVKAECAAGVTRDHAGPEANGRFIKVECEVGETQDHKGPKSKSNSAKGMCEVGVTQGHTGPEAKQINLVKVQGAAESFRVHHVPEATVKVSGLTETGSGMKILILQNERDSEKVKRVNPEPTTHFVEEKTSSEPIMEDFLMEDNPVLNNNHRLNEIDEKTEWPSVEEKRRISVGNCAGYSTLDDPEMDQMTEIREGIPVMDDSFNEFGELNPNLDRNFTERNTVSCISIDNSSPVSTTSSPHASHVKLISMPQRDRHSIIILEGKPHKKTIEGKPQEKINEGKPRKKKMNEGNPQKEMKQ